MKPISILFLIITLSTGLCFAQNIVVENRIWSVATFEGEGNGVSTNHKTFKGDTLIGQYNYKYVLTSWSSNSANWISSNVFIREDSGKVFLYKRNINREVVLYDFNLNVGDEFYEDYLMGTHVVDSIVLKEIQGEFLQHIYLSNEGSGYMLWIEKYGSYQGVLTPFPITGGSSVLLCVKDQGELVYINEEFNTCELNGTYTNNRELLLLELTVKCIQNNLVMVQNRSNTKGLITFYDLNGKLVLKESVETGTTQLCLPYSGLFIYRFQTENGQCQSGKIVVMD